ncbi:MAG: hypothetical protein KF914_10995 [Rhizobiaceae bacterium]|nr:hypothetical protein [Rhizobiaceae bacterium]
MCQTKTFNRMVKGYDIKFTVSAKTGKDRVGVVTCLAPTGVMAVEGSASSTTHRPPLGNSLYVGDAVELTREISKNASSGDLPNFANGQMIEFNLHAACVGAPQNAPPIKLGFVQYLTEGRRFAEYKQPAGQVVNFAVKREELRKGGLLLDCGIRARPWLNGASSKLGGSATECSVRATDNPNWKVPVHLKLDDQEGLLSSLDMRNEFQTFVVASYEQGGIEHFIRLASIDWNILIGIDKVKFFGRNKFARNTARTQISADMSCGEWKLVDEIVSDISAGNDVPTANTSLSDFIQVMGGEKNTSDAEEEFDVLAAMGELDDLASALSG